MVRALTLDCVILKRFDLNEADRVLTVFSSARGKVSVLAKGVRRVVSRKAGVVEVGNHARLHVVEGSHFFILQEAQLVHAFQQGKARLATIKYIYYMLELVDVLLPEHQAHEDVYELLLHALTLVNGAPRKIFIRAFEMKLLNRLGYLTIRALDLDGDRVSGSEYLSVESSEILECLQNYDWKAISDLACDSDCAQRLELFLQHRIRLVTERSIRSLAVFD